ncbi:MAG: magnesium and cobalt transport protein CorA, partial [Nitrospira sp.]|nr:magnesium and cobalt transport protein CorA [Nitrospira sp.]
MAKLMKKKSKQVGLPPGTLVHIGEKKTGQVKITLFDYDEGHCEEKEIRTLEECFQYKDKATVTWINVDGIHDTEIIEKLGQAFGLHPLVMEDILHTGQRPKMDDYSDYIYIVLKMLNLDKNMKIDEEQVSLILG